MPMKTLIIPDIHLKPQIFADAKRIMSDESCDIAVCLGDIADDWGNQQNLELYEKTYDAAINFAKTFPETLWCYGNHDLSYEYDEWETGFSIMAVPVVKEKLAELRKSLPDPSQIAIIHRIDNILFSHAGVIRSFVREYCSTKAQRDPDAMIWEINTLGKYFLWKDHSPIWARPQYPRYADDLYRPRASFQVVGHTPMKEPTQTDNLLSCDVFSTYRDGKPIGTCEFVIIETENTAWYKVPAHI